MTNASTQCSNEANVGNERLRVAVCVCRDRPGLRKRVMRNSAPAVEPVKDAVPYA